MRQWQPAFLYKMWAHFFLLKARADLFTWILTIYQLLNLIERYFCLQNKPLQIRLPGNAFISLFPNTICPLSKCVFSADSSQDCLLRWLRWPEGTGWPVGTGRRPIVLAADSSPELLLPPNPTHPFNTPAHPLDWNLNKDGSGCWLAPCERSGL